MTVILVDVCVAEVVETVVLVAVALVVVSDVSVAEVVETVVLVSVPVVLVAVAEVDV